MFCNQCGNKLPDGTKFCGNCGAALGENTQPAVADKPKSKGKMIGGIVLVALGALSVLGSFANDYYWNIAHNGVNMSDVVTIGIQIAMVAVGGYLIYKSKK